MPAVLPKCSEGIESVVEEDEEGRSSGSRDVMCPACQMAVVWMQSQLKQNKTQELILNYANEVYVTIFCVASRISLRFWILWPHLKKLHRFVRSCLVHKGNQLWTVETLQLCLLFPSQLVAKRLISPQKRFTFV